MNSCSVVVFSLISCSFCACWLWITLGVKHFSRFIGASSWFALDLRFLVLDWLVSPIKALQWCVIPSSNLLPYFFLSSITNSRCRLNAFIPSSLHPWPRTVLFTWPFDPVYDRKHFCRVRKGWWVDVHPFRFQYRGLLTGLLVGFWFRFGSVIFLTCGSFLLESSVVGVLSVFSFPSTIRPLSVLWSNSRWKREDR